MSDVLSRDAVARCYAEALFDVISTDDDFEKQIKDFAYLAALVSSPEAVQFWNSPWESFARKEQFLKDVVLSEVVGHFSESICNAFLVMLKEQRMDMALHASTALRALQESYQKKQKGTVVFAQAESREVVDVVRAMAESIFSCSLELKESVNPELIAGFVITVGHLRYDASLQNHLSHLKSYLKAYGQS